MTFTATATIQSIEKLNNKFFKVLLEDEKGNHIIVNIPISKEQELALNTKIDIWGNISAFPYQSKWYNNLFAQTVVPESKRYILLQKVEIAGDGPSQFKILEYSNEPFTKEFISEKYDAELLMPKNIATRIDISALIKSTGNVIEETRLQNENILKNKCTNVENSHIQNSESKNLISIDHDVILVDKNTEFSIKHSGKTYLVIFKTKNE